MYIAKSVIDGKIDFDSRLSKLLDSCTGCLSCDDICEVVRYSKPYVHPFEIVRLMRSEMVRRGVISEKRLKQIRVQTEVCPKHTSFVNKAISGIPDGLLDDSASTVLFVDEHEGPGTRLYDTLLRLITKIGEPIAVISDHGVKLYDFYDFGFWNEIGGRAKSMFSGKTLKGKQLVFANPHWQEFFAHRYGEIVGLGKGKNIRTRHVSEVLLKAVKDGKLQTKKKTKRVKVSYHDPCYLGRGLGIYDAPRELLRSLDGVQLVEMERIRRNSFCCGARGGNEFFTDFSKSIAEERLREFAETGADVLITACPYCKDVLGARDIAEFAAERLVYR